MKWAIDCFIVRCSDILLTINFADKIKTMLNKKALQFGLVLGGISILLSVIIYFLFVGFQTNWKLAFSLGIIGGLVGLGFKIFFSIRLKKASGLELITYWQAFFAIVIISVVSGIISSGYEITANHINPNLLENVHNATIQTTTSSMEYFGAPQEKIDAKIDEMIQGFEEEKNISLFGILKGILKSLVWYAIFGFIMAIFVRKTPPLFPESGVQQPAQNP